MNFSLLLTALLIAFLPCSPAWSAVTLGQLVQDAQENQTDWQRAQVESKKAEGNVTLERSKFLPDLSLRSSYGYDWQQTAEDVENVNSSAALVTNWSLYDNGTSFRNFKIRTLERTKGRVNELKTRDDVSYEILTRYIQHSFSRRQRDITKQKLSLLEIQHRTTERQFRQGMKTRRDYQRLQSEVARAKLNLMRLEDQTRDSFEEFIRYLGNPSSLTNEDQLTISNSETLVESLKKRMTSFQFTESSTLAAQIARLDLDIQKIKTRELHSTLWPQLSLQTEAGYGSDNFARSSQSWSDQERFFAGAQAKLTWSLFDWRGRASQYRNAILDEKLSELRYKQSVLDNKIAFQKNDRQVVRQEQSLKVMRNIYDIERRTYIDIENEYREGKATYLDLITSLDRQTQAQIDLEQELNSYLLVLADILRNSGELYAEATKF